MPTVSKPRSLSELVGSFRLADVSRRIVISGQNAGAVTGGGVGGLDDTHGSNDGNGGAENKNRIVSVKIFYKSFATTYSPD
jgi:hypothetical protein